tara:strand:+ start:96 stop:791 length:696 start_codon:yes stop_codon:yes gene_type:complete
MSNTKLLTAPHGSAKTNKSMKFGYANFIMYLSPYKKSGWNVCTAATTGCIDVCLDEAGRANWTEKNGLINPIHAARLKRTQFFFNDRGAFLEQLEREIKAAIRWSLKRDLIPVIRLNGTSDLRWEDFNIIQKFNNIQFYDYTKIYNRKNLPNNYHLTFSRAESNQKQTLNALVNGLNVSAVFRNKLPKTYLNKKVINGDKHDLRFLDPKNVIVGLIAKGKAKKDQSGFVLN